MLSLVLPLVYLFLMLLAIIKSYQKMPLWLLLLNIIPIVLVIASFSIFLLGFFSVINLHYIIIGSLIAFLIIRPINGQLIYQEVHLFHLVIHGLITVIFVIVLL
ncbi:hypothetical protein [Streptococcus zalophi]|uniref:Uncharacterized protein n=1 Tax=Streptococcus zalophi TaxID=640031 RepID=A0A934UDH3_9STRE|nr:hypothetical protein [Streptococcus zalophi]MBJ8349801.1 hypothetical protein [Streptococcus zalophi]MCR8967570.1 hypothetical protein [Streptococcus zalophi]